MRPLFLAAPPFLRNLSILTALALLPAQAQAEEVLYDNGINLGFNTGGIESDLDASFSTGMPQLIADDFLISSPSQITAVSWQGAHLGMATPIDDFTIRFFNHAGGPFGTFPNLGPSSLLAEFTPGMNVNRTLIGTSGMGNPIYSYRTPVDLTVAPGIYWISIYNDTTGVTSADNWLWLFYAGIGNHHVDNNPDFLTSFAAVDGNAFTIFGIPIVGPARPREEPPPILLIDHLAILSAETTGLNTVRMNRSVTNLATNAATRDLNQRIFRQRAGLTANGGSGGGLWGNPANGNGPPNGASTNDDLRYLNFAANQMIDYRVALGLADGEEVELVSDTLSTGEFGWAGHPVAMLGGPVALPVSMKAVVAVPEGSGKEVHDDKMVVAEVPSHLFEIYTAFDYGFYDQDNLTKSVRGFDVDNYAGSLGAEVKLFPWLAAGAAFTHTESDAEAFSNLGSIDLEGQLLSAYLTAASGHTYFDVLYSYGDFDNEVNRNTLLGSTARGDTDSFSHNLSLNAGHNLHLTDQVVATPYTGLDYSTGGIDGYSERGGGRANLVYPDDNFESMTGRLGAALTFTTDTQLGKVTLQGRGAWAHEFMPETDTVSASLQTSPFVLVTGGTARRIGSFTATGNDAHAGTDWLELGAGVRLDLGDSGFNVQLDYEGQFARNNASAHFGSAKIGYEW